MWMPLAWSSYRLDGLPASAAPAPWWAGWASAMSLEQLQSWPLSEWITMDHYGIHTVTWAGHHHRNCLSRLSRPRFGTNEDANLKETPTISNASRPDFPQPHKTFSQGAWYANVSRASKNIATPVRPLASQTAGLEDYRRSESFKQFVWIKLE